VERNKARYARIRSLRDLRPAGQRGSHGRYATSAVLGNAPSARARSLASRKGVPAAFTGSERPALAGESTGAPSGRFRASYASVRRGWGARCHSPYGRSICGHRRQAAETGHPRQTLAQHRLNDGPMRPRRYFGELEQFSSSFRAAQFSGYLRGGHLVRSAQILYNPPRTPPEPLYNSCFPTFTGARRLPLRQIFVGSGLPLRRNPTP